MAEQGVQSLTSEEQCRELVDRILTSAEFRKATRLRDFLLYVVDRRFAGSMKELSEVFIGQRVFGRPAAYNPSEDSIVRTEARNLRQRLERYFAGEGRDEPVVLEIPKGGYYPVFRPRNTPAALETVAAVPPSRLPTRRFWLLSGAGALAAVAGGWKVARSRSAHNSVPGSEAAPIVPGRVEFASSDVRLVNGLQWAKQRALGYAYSGDPVGAWYDSTAGNRYAFCMRDVSHQSIGASVLGLSNHTRNMLRHFAGSISGSRDWCGYWEINKDGFPAPIDYQDDKHFWYCLPANFDVMQACYRQFLWTGDRTYFDAVFSNFYDRSVTNYVQAWDRDHDGLMESGPEAGRRGIPSYYQQDPRPLIGGDLIAAQYRGYLVYAAIQQGKGAWGSLSQKLAGEYRAKAEALRVRYNTDWWNAAQSRHYMALLPDHQYYDGYIDAIHVKALWFDITEPGLKTEAALDLLEKNRSHIPQVLSYFPDILFQYGRNAAAYEYLLQLLDPDFQGRGMPEVVFVAIGAAATGLMGITADAPAESLETLSRLPKQVDWVEAARVPALQNEISVRHRGTSETMITNQAGPAFEWKAVFPAGGTNDRVFVDGSPLPAAAGQLAGGQLVISVRVPMRPGQTRTARLETGRS